MEVGWYIYTTDGRMGKVRTGVQEGGGGQMMRGKKQPKMMRMINICKRIHGNPSNSM